MIKFVYKCSTCGKQYQRDEVRYLCPSCAKDYHAGIPLVGVLSVEFDYEAIKKQFDKRNPDWTLFSAVEKKYFPPLPVGGTPFFKSVALGKELGFDDVWIKNDGLNPSGSLKDRASFLVAAEANRLGEKTIVTASTGNAASALAAVCAAAGIKAVILGPEKAPRAKLAQMLVHGACVIPVRGTYDDAFRLTLEYTNSKGGLNRNTAYHPLTIEGKKTVGLEMFQQNNWKAPEAIFVPVGDGVILAGVIVALAPGDHAKISARNLQIGILATVIAALGGALGAVLSRKAYFVAHAAGEHPDPVTTGYQRVLGGAIALALVFLVVKWRHARHHRDDAQMKDSFSGREKLQLWPWVLANSLAGQTIGVSCMQWALENTPTGIVTAIIATTPIVMLPLARLIEGERITARSLTGGLVAVAGVMGLTFWR